MSRIYMLRVNSRIEGIFVLRAKVYVEFKCLILLYFTHDAMSKICYMKEELTK